ncbi:O-methyltransferase [Nocardia sp. CC227C]|uniref:O-methyltransferase n=1 Tax=Nocardia sp. CC227C TaxID=3044562 RepID=UPI00278C2E5D|nr:class I SAM-dependent methyltransferase [Nocardia sp. CC227C]
MKTVRMTEELMAYVTGHTSLYDDAQRRLVAETERLGGAAIMQVAPDQGAFLTLITQLIRARRVVEVGTFTGYSALCMARGLPADGRLITCEINPDWVPTATAAWERAGVADRIELRLGPALDTLRDLDPDFAIDLAFIDADKSGYIAYYEELVPRMRPGGVILADNVLWFGTVAVPPFDESAELIREFNAHVLADPRVDSVVLTIGDGVNLIRRKS